MIADLLLRLPNRYPTAAERTRATDYLATVPARLAAFEELRVTQKAVIAEVIAEYAKLYPRFNQYHPAAWDKATRDMEHYVVFCANAVVLGETDALDNSWLHWFRTILKAVHMTPQFMHDAFRLWDAASKRQLSPATYALMKPVLDHMAKRLCDLPEPARAEVGDRREPLTGAARS